jgi:hypothetical protein
MSKDTITVYWTPSEVFISENTFTLLDSIPKSVMSDIQKRRNVSKKGKPNWSPTDYQSCTALHTLTKNLFFVTAPLDTVVELDNEGNIISVTPESHRVFFTERLSSIEDAFSVDFFRSYFLFCEETLEVSITPPYMHENSQSQEGFISAIKFDISKWFRPFVFIYQLWPNKTKLTFKAGEPIAYLHFNTDKKVIFKQFKLTEEILNVSNACLEHKKFVPFEPMNKLYERFTGTNLYTRLLKEIKNNLID